MGVRARAAVCLALSLALSGCFTRNDPVDDEGQSFWSEPRSARPAPTPQPTPTPAPDYVVAPGDTLYGIAFRQRLDWRELAAWNDIPAPYTIYPGQPLRLKATGSASDGSIAPRPTVADALPAPTATPRPPPPAKPLADMVEQPRQPPAESPAVTETFAVSESSGARALPLRESGAAVPSPAPMPSERAPGERAVPGEPGSRKDGRPAAPAPIATPSPDAVAASGTQATAVLPSPGPPPMTPPAPTRSSAGLQWRWPVRGNLLGRFRSGDPTHQGINVQGRAGDRVAAAADGEVVYSGNGLVGYGELIIVKHSAELLSAYGGSGRRLVTEGSTVKAGQALAELGGNNVLHFEVRRAGKPVDPLDFLPQR